MGNADGAGAAQFEGCHFTFLSGQNVYEVGSTPQPAQNAHFTSRGSVMFTGCILTTDGRDPLRLVNLGRQRTQLL